MSYWLLGNSQLAPLETRRFVITLQVVTLPNAGGETMAKYWVRIVLGALLVFGVGYAAYATGRGFVHRIDSDQDLTIPLGSFVPFKLNGEKLGTFRSLVIRRSSPRAISGFELRARLTDSTALERVRDCKLSVTDPAHIDERTTFFCLPADSGYEAFGEIRLDLRVGSDTRTVIQPLLLPEAVVRDLRRTGSDSVPGRFLGDSIASEVRARVRVQSRAYSDSVRAASLEASARRMQQKADSIRGRSPKPPPNP